MAGARVRHMWVLFGLFYLFDLHHWADAYVFCEFHSVTEPFATQATIQMFFSSFLSTSSLSLFHFRFPRLSSPCQPRHNTLFANRYAITGRRKFWKFSIVDCEWRVHESIIITIIDIYVLQPSYRRNKSNERGRTLHNNVDCITSDASEKC